MRVAVIGAGRMGRRHLQVVRRLGLSIAGICDISAESRRLAQAEHDLSGAQLFEDAERLLAKSKPECVIVATTADSHCKLTCAAARHGARFILVEKPMSVSMAECDLMVDACRESGAALAVNHQMRYMPIYAEPKRLLDSQAFGGMTSMTVVAGNFGFSMNGGHYLEAFRFLAGEDPVEVSAWFSPGVVPNHRGRQFEDRAGCIRAVTAGGRRIYLEAGSDQGHGIVSVYAARNGLITVNELTGEMNTTERDAQHRHEPTTRYGLAAFNRRRVIDPAEVIDSTAAVLGALLGGGEFVSGSDGRIIVSLLTAAYRSAESGGAPVRPGSDPDRNRIFPWA